MSAVWYVAYGSNMSARRFRCYLEGGLPDGAAWPDAGCGDVAAPVEDRPIELTHPVAFAGRSSRWGGGIAFLGEQPAGARTLARAYLVTVDQLLDIASQENRGEAGAFAHLDRATVLGEGARLDSGWYGSILRIGELDGHPTLTITGAASPPDEPPSDQYLRHLAAGLRESHGLELDAVARYVAAIPGVGRDEAAVAAALA